MNYKQLYQTFILYCKETPILDRMSHRNCDDFRLKLPKIYTEIHHIIPKSLGGNNDDLNLVELLPEEHLFAHKLRYKAFNNRQDFISVKLIIKGIKYNKRYGSIPNIINNKINSSYAWIKQNSSSFRIEHGWQTKEGAKRISEARKNTFPVKCVKTGKIIGSFDKTHPKILSGEWVHISKGMHKFYNKNTKETLYCDINDTRLLSGEWTGHNYDTTGEKNSNYSGITDEEITIFYRKVSLVLKEKYNCNNLPSMKYIGDIWNFKYHQKRKFPSLRGGLVSGFRFNGNLYENLIYPIGKELNMNYVKYTKIARKIRPEEIANVID